jgi:hypothetical protein
MRLPEECLCCGANRVTAGDLAERAEWVDILAGLHACHSVARSIANIPRILVVVKQFNREEVDFAGERQADNKRIHPVSVSRFAKPSQVDRSLLVDPDFLRSGSLHLYLYVYYQKAHEMGTVKCVLVIKRCPSPTEGCIRDFWGSAARQSRNQTRLVGAGLALPQGTPRGAPTKGTKILLRKQEVILRNVLDAVNLLYCASKKRCRSRAGEY